MLNDQTVFEGAFQLATQSAMAQPGFLKIEKLAKTYVAYKPVFADVSFTVARGELFASLVILAVAKPPS